MSINVTPIPRLIDLAAPAFTLGTANAAGSAATAVASDSTLLAFDAVAVDAITFGQTGSVGTATVAPRRDHVHAMEAETPTVAATQAEMEAAASNTVFVTPGRDNFHPGVAKGWVRFNGTGTLAINVEHNASNVTDAGTAGQYDVLWDTDFSSVYYPWVAFCGGPLHASDGIDAAPTAGKAEITTFNDSDAAADSDRVYAIAFGTQD